MKTGVTETTAEAYCSVSILWMDTRCKFLFECELPSAAMSRVQQLEINRGGDRAVNEARRTQIACYCKKEYKEGMNNSAQEIVPNHA